ncbi:hypothetical protein C4B68_27935 [Streptomyces dengpaensis]|uniref:Core-binding (CB) domain-containing protein n=1 Tax=Streptomyces dengpaensis TaxID=2049881 RepID=A0ABM6SWM9_9ACTN|nr:hypothetical protein C4B68_27935 [Streptomyces dengpaensis]
MGWFKDRDYAATTRERNVGVLNRHILPTFRTVPLREITTPQVRRWRTDLLDAGVGPATVSKAYQVLRAIMNTAVDDGLIERNPCRVKGAGTVTHTERPFLSVPEVYRLADAVPPHCRALVLLAAFAALRFGELAALQRRDIDLGGPYRVRPSLVRRDADRRPNGQGTQERGWRPHGDVPGLARPRAGAPPGRVRECRPNRARLRRRPRWCSGAEQLPADLAPGARRDRPR